MKYDRLDRMVKGWFVGAFQPTVFSTAACEVAVKYYKAGDCEDAHYHNVATEITLVLNGKVSMLDKSWSDGDIITISPGEATAFKALTDATTVVVKLPGALDDKFLI